MSSTSGDSLDTVEIVMVFEEVFGVVLPVDGAQRLKPEMTQQIGWSLIFQISGRIDRRQQCSSDSPSHGKVQS